MSYKGNLAISESELIYSVEKVQFWEWKLEKYKGQKRRQKLSKTTQSKVMSSLSI